MVQSDYKINTLFLTYFQENLHCIVETGLLPPLKKTGNESLQKWVLFQRNLFVSEKKTKIFTGKIINISINGFPQGIQKTLQKSVFDTPVKSYASIRGISAAYTTALRNAVASVNYRLFFPMQLDWRGRLYYRTGFSPSQDAFTRTLISFSEPILIKANTDSEYFFFVALAKAIKKQDASSYQKYFNFVLDHQEDILESLTNFYWVTFDEPFVALNLIQNFKIYIKQNSQNQKEKGVLLYVKV